MRQIVKENVVAKTCVRVPHHVIGWITQTFIGSCDYTTVLRRSSKRQINREKSVMEFVNNQKRAGFFLRDKWWNQSRFSNLLSKTGMKSIPWDYFNLEKGVDRKPVDEGIAIFVDSVVNMLQLSMVTLPISSPIWRTATQRHIKKLWMQRK